MRMLNCIRSFVWLNLIYFFCKYNLRQCNSFQIRSSLPCSPINKSSCNIFERYVRKRALFESGVLMHSKSQLSTSNDDDVTEKTPEILTSSYIALGALLFVSISCQWGRQVIYYLCDFSSTANSFKHVNIDLNFSQEMYGYLASIAFSVTFTIFSVVAGSASDKYNRKVIITTAALLSSALILLQSMSTEFNQFFIFRAFLGSIQAFINPAVYTLISDIFPSSLRGSVNGIYSGGIYIGGGLASLSVLIDQMIGWKATFFLISCLGLLATISSLFLVQDPRNLSSTEILPLNNNDRNNNNNNNSIMINPLSTINNSLSQINSRITNVKNTKNSFSIVELWNTTVQTIQSPEVIFLLSASTLRFCAGFTIGVWKAPFVFSKFPEDITSFASTNAFIVAGIGLLSSILGGILSDFIMNSNTLPSYLRARSWVPAAGSLLAAPLWAGFILATSAEQSLAFLFFEYLIGECWFGSAVAALSAAVPPQRRGTAQGIFSTLTSVGNIAPVIVGSLVSGQLGGASKDLSSVLLYTVCGLYVSSGALFAAAATQEVRHTSTRTE